SDVLAALTRTNGVDGTAVVTNDLAAETLALGIATVLGDETEAGQSQAADVGIRHAQAAGFERVLLVPGDTPLIDPGEVDQLLDRAARADGVASRARRREVAGLTSVEIRALPALPEVGPGDDLGGLLASALPDDLSGSDVVAVAHKVVSKSEGRLRGLDDIEASPDAERLAREQDKDPRVVQAILDESVEVLRAERGVIVCVTRQGLICANAGVDASNAPAGQLVLLPVDPDESARRLRARLGDLSGVRPAVVVTDSFGRPWRTGQADVAIGAAGVEPVDDWRGREDAHGRTLRGT